MSFARCATVAFQASKPLATICRPAVGATTSQLGQCGDVREYSKRANVRRHYKSSSDSSDSDRGRGSGRDKRGKRGESAFWMKKMRTHHQLLDVNKDGVVSWDDFQQLISRFTQFGHLSPKEIDNFTDALRHVWETEWGASGDPYVFIGQEQFLTNMQHVVNTKDLRKRIAKPLPYFFKAVDTDGSGEISIEEFTMFYKCLGLSEADAARTFEVIDLNKDGKINIKEFVKLGRDFFLSEDEARPSQFFWGPLTR